MHNPVILWHVTVPRWHVKEMSKLKDHEGCLAGILKTGRLLHLHGWRYG